MDHTRSVSDAGTPDICLNCKAALQGPYCASCGQRAVRLDVSLRELAHEGLHEFVHLDGRIVSTLRLLLTRPGRLTAEMLAGRRQRYVSPIRLYLVCSVIFFAVMSLLIPAAQPVPADLVARDRDLVETPQGQPLSPALKQAVMRVAGDPATFTTKVWTTAPKAAFILLPAFALLTMAVFRRRVRFFVPHLYFALHFHSFLFLALIPLLLLGNWASSDIAIAGVALLAPLYLVTSAGKTFEVARLEALGKSLFVLSIYGLLLAITVAIVAVVSALSM